MSLKTNPTRILIAEDDEDDRLLMQEALQASARDAEVRFVEDGEDLSEYLGRRGAYAEPGAAPRPHLILLDLRMPRKDGWEVLAELKGDPDLRSIPVVVFSTSNAEIDVRRSYELGASSYITKPRNYRALADGVSGIEHYWLHLARLPEAEDG